MTLKSGLDRSRSLKMVPFESLRTVSYSHSIVILTLSCMVPAIKRDIGRKLLSDFFVLRVFDAPVTVSLGILSYGLVRQKT